jgi:hypothetical protein
MRGMKPIGGNGAQKNHGAKEYKVSSRKAHAKAEV